jgi:hypothetical protein
MWNEIAKANRANDRVHISELCTNFHQEVFNSSKESVCQFVERLEQYKTKLMNTDCKLTNDDMLKNVKTATEVGVRAIQDHKVIEWNTCWKCRLSEGTDDM